MTRAKLQIGLIGAGQMGRGHIACLKRIDEIDLRALADPHEPSIRQTLEAVGGEVAVYDDYRDLLSRADVEAVIVATPNFTHADIVVDALAAGKHVLCEKPMATTPEDCDRMIAARDQSGKILQIGLELRSDAAMRKVHDLLRAGEIGRPWSLWIKEFRGPFLLKVDRWITKKDRSGDTLVEKDCHHYDLFNWFADSPVRYAAAFGGCDVELDHSDVLDNAWTIQEHANGARSALGLCMFADRSPHGPEVGVIGSEGMIVHQYGGPVRLYPRRDNAERLHDVTVPPDIAPLSHNGAVYYEHLSWLSAIREGAPVRVTGEIGRESVIVGLACQRAIAERRVVDLDKEFRS
ncbi:MAG: Gfo/Idh/MocA family oxidoreductase [Planctomycetota bacterium]